MATTTTGDTINANGHAGTIDFSGLKYVPGAYATYDTATDVLAVYSGNYYSSVTLNDPGTTSFNAVPDSTGGTEAVPLCFVTGTLIRTKDGDRAVERLRVGDVAVTASGRCRPIRWIGHRVIDCGTRAVPSDAWPVRVRAGAFGVGPCGASLPERDLQLSPGHPVIVGTGADEVLVPVMCLINGTSVARAPVDRVTYWHVELDAHDVLLAEGLPAESFLDLGNRPWFEGASDDSLADPDYVAPGALGRCRPVAVDGAVVEAERRRLDAIFATDLARASYWPTLEIAFA